MKDEVIAAIDCTRSRFYEKFALGGESRDKFRPKISHEIDMATPHPRVAEANKKQSVSFVGSGLNSCMCHCPGAFISIITVAHAQHRATRGWRQPKAAWPCCGTFVDKQSAALARKGILIR
jgi:hypothetical protein